MPTANRPAMRRSLCSPPSAWATSCFGLGLLPLGSQGPCTPFREWAFFCLISVLARFFPFKGLDLNMPLLGFRGPCTYSFHGFGFLIFGLRSNFSFPRAPFRLSYAVPVHEYNGRRAGSGRWQAACEQGAASPFGEDLVEVGRH